MLRKKNGKEDTLLAFTQNGKFCFSMRCLTFPPKMRVVRVEAFARIIIPRFKLMVGIKYAADILPTQLIQRTFHNKD